MRTDAVVAIGTRPSPLIAACWWGYERAPARLDIALEFARRYVAPLLDRRLEVHWHQLDGGERGSVVSAGDGMTLRFLQRRLGPMTLAASDATGILGLASALRQWAREDDLVLAMVPRAVAGRVGRDFLRVPGLVSLHLPIKNSLDATLEPATTTVRRDARRVLDSGITWSATRAPDEFELFYDNYYDPSVRSRFGDLAVVRERAMLRRQFRHGGALLWLEQEGRRIAGTVVQVRRGVLHGLVAAADPALHHDGRAGPQFAVKIASLDLAARLGAAAVDLGGTVPSLRDGGLRAKRAFGASVQRFEAVHRDLLLAWRPGTFPVRRLLHEAPLLFETAAGLSAVAAAPPGQDPDPATGLQLWRQYAPRGLHRLFLLGASRPLRLHPDGREGCGPIVLWPDRGAADLAAAAERTAA